MALLTQADYAKERGCTEAAVSAARKQRIKAAEVLVDGKVLIDSEKANRLWAQNSRQRRGSGRKPATEKAAAAAKPQDRQAPAARPSISDLTDEQLRAYVDGLPEDEIPDFGESQKRREHYQAERARIAALKDREEVVPANQVKAEAFALARALRDGLMRVADRLAPTLAATADARQVHHLLTEELRVALRGLGDA
jgi:hypothetical protein